MRIAVLVGGDLATYHLVRAVASVLEAGTMGSVVSRWANYAFPAGLLQGWQAPAALLIALAIAGAYGAGDKRRDAGRLFKGAALAGLLVLYEGFWTGPFFTVLYQYVVTTAIVAGAVLGERRLVDYGVRRFWHRVGLARALLVFQDDLDWGYLARVLARANDLIVVGTVQLHEESDPDGVPYAAEVASAIERMQADAVLVWGDVSDESFVQVVDLALASGCRVLTGARRGEAPGVEPVAVWIDGCRLTELRAPCLSGSQLLLKRTMDIVGSLIGLMISAPLFLLIAVAIKLDSSGPVFFRQVRVGRAGRPFRIFKFRSMVADAEAHRSQLSEASIYSDERLFKVRHDPRITRLGRILRKTSLDELPQLINVLRGDMSLVGPRPPVPSEVALYQERHYCRFDVKPGMTGPWQVSGRNGVTDFEEVIRLERDYIRTWDLGTDLRILLHTVPAVLRMREAH